MPTDTTITIEEIVAAIKLADSYLDKLCSQEGIAGNEPCEFNWARESLDDAIGYLNDYLEENQKKEKNNE